MSKVRMLLDLTGLNYDHPKDSEVEVDDATANQWVRANIAAHVTESLTSPDEEVVVPAHDTEAGE